MRLVYQGEQSLSFSAKRVLAVITLRTLMASSDQEGERNEYTIVLAKKHFEQSFPSLTPKRLYELLILIMDTRFFEPKLGYEHAPILVEASVSPEDGSAHVTVGSDYMDCVLKLGCLPT